MGILKTFDNKKHNYYKPVNIEKFLGTSLPICRSSWEFKFCRYLDFNPGVLEWSSEGYAIKYFDPITNKTRRYIPDFYMKIKSKDGDEIRYLIEIKPFKQTQPPKKRQGKKQTFFVNEQKTFMTNKAKWEAAVNWCNQNNFMFKIITEKSLF